MAIAGISRLALPCCRLFALLLASLELLLREIIRCCYVFRVHLSIPVSLSFALSILLRQQMRLRVTRERDPASISTFETRHHFHYYAVRSPPFIKPSAKLYQNNNINIPNGYPNLRFLLPSPLGAFFAVVH